MRFKLRCVQRVLALCGLLPFAGAGIGFAQIPANASKMPAAGGPFVRMVRHNDGSRTVTAKDTSKAEQEVLTYDPQGDLKLRRIYQLDRYGKPVNFMIQDGQGTAVLRGEFTYDVRDRMSEERLYSVPGNQMIRKLVQDYDPSTGKKLNPRIQNFAALPSELLYWMDPDSADPHGPGAPAKGADGKTAGADKPSKPGLRGLFKKDKGK